MYKAALFATDGEYVTYHHSSTVDGVIDKLNNQGSMWYFFPYHAVIRDRGGLITRDNQRLMSVAEPFEEFKGKTIRTFVRFLSTLTPEDHEIILGV